MRGWKQVVVGVAAVALAACGGDGGGGGGGGGEDYPDELVDTFMASCTQGGTPESVCQCALDKFEAKYSAEEFAAESVRISQGQPSDEFEQDIQTFSVDCAEEEVGS